MRGVKVASLLEDLDKRPEFILVRAGDGLRISRDSESSNIAYESLAHERPDRAMDPFVLTVPAGGGRGGGRAGVPGKCGFSPPRPLGVGGGCPPGDGPQASVAGGEAEMWCHCFPGAGVSS